MSLLREDIKNHSDVPVPYQFMAEYLNVFSFDTISGFVAPHSQKYVTIKFEPTELANYWKRGRSGLGPPTG